MKGDDIKRPTKEKVRITDFLIVRKTATEMRSMRMKKDIGKDVLYTKKVCIL